MSLSITKLTPQITYERLKDYKLLLAGQLTIMVNDLVVYEIFNRYPFPNYQQVFLAIMGTVMLAMNFLAYQLLKDLTESKFIRILTSTLLVSGMFLGIATGQIPVIKLNTPLYYSLTVFSMCCTLTAFFMLLYFMLYDIFNEKHDILYRLWGAACIYLLIGAMFGIVYFILEIFFPAEFGLTQLPDIFQFVKCYAFSFYTLSGVDQPFENFSQLVRNVSVIESIFSNLYIVLLVGRLLSK